MRRNVFYFYVFLVHIISSTVKNPIAFRFKLKVRAASCFQLKNSFLETLQGRFNSLVSKNEEPQKTDDDMMREYLEAKPWRAPKVKNLKYRYFPCKDSWQDRLLDSDSDAINFYSQPKMKPFSQYTRPEDIWDFPWLWHRIKADRLSWLHKQFTADVTATTVQEHMEIDAFMSEFDMPYRWGQVRMKELDTLLVAILIVAAYTDFNGVKPTDLGIRPDGTLKSCPVQFQTCVSTSSDPADITHYVPPLRWVREKSPDQAFEEIKNVYLNYPKRGLRFTYGFIDRGGWKPQSFGGDYFYAQADSVLWDFTDDIELLIDREKREVQYRSSTRLAITDFDVEKIRYNEFVRLLSKEGGWDVHYVEQNHWLRNTPYRWTDLLLTKTGAAVERAADATLVGIEQVRMREIERERERER